MMRYLIITALCPPVLVPYCSNMMHYPLLTALPHPLLCSLLVESLLEYDAMSSLSCLASSCARFYSILIQIFCDVLSSLPCLLLCSFRFLLKSDSNMMHYPLLVALPHPLLCSFLIESLLEYDAMSSPSCLASPCARFLSNPFSNMIRYPLLAALPPPVFGNVTRASPCKNANS